MFWTLTLSFDKNILAFFVWLLFWLLFLKFGQIFSQSSGPPCGSGQALTLNLGMEQHTLKNVNNCLNTSIYSYLETSGGQSSYPYLNVVHFFNTRVNKKSVAA
jgi:hypothetical protein